MRRLTFNTTVLSKKINQVLDILSDVINASVTFVASLFIISVSSTWHPYLKVLGISVGSVILACAIAYLIRSIAKFKKVLDVTFRKDKILDELPSTACLISYVSLTVCVMLVFVLMFTVVASAEIRDLHSFIEALSAIPLPLTALAMVFTLPMFLFAVLSAFKKRVMIFLNNNINLLNKGLRKECLSSVFSLIFDELCKIMYRTILLINVI